MKRVILKKIIIILVLLILPLSYSVQARQAFNAEYIRVGLNLAFDPYGDLLPMTCRDTISCEVATIIFPRIIGVDPTTGMFASGAPGNSLVLDWEVSDDGLIYTFTIRQDAVWSDGTPITAQDVVFSLNASRPASTVQSVIKLSDYRFQVTFWYASCNALFDIDTGVVPAHYFENNPNAVWSDPFASLPIITYGPFEYEGLDIDTGEMSLTTNPNYAGGEVNSEGLVLVGYNSADEATEAFLRGEVDVLYKPPQRRFAELRALPEIQFISFPGTANEYIALNLADPLDPKDGVDSSGNLMYQGFHPILGDVRVRQALQAALDLKTIVQETVAGEATLLNSYTERLSWAYDESLFPVAYNPERAVELLESAGWILGEDGIRVASGAPYAAEGTRLHFTLVTNQESTRRVAVATAMVEQFRAVGVELELQIVPFNDLLSLPLAQTYDSFLAGWSDTYPIDPRPNMFDPYGDHVNDPRGGNDTSYNNDWVNWLVYKAEVSPDCSPNALRQYYHELQRIIQADQPYLWLFTMHDAYVASDRVENFHPYPNLLFWNANEWQLGE